MLCVSLSLGVKMFELLYGKYLGISVGDDNEQGWRVSLTTTGDSKGSVTGTIGHRQGFAAACLLGASKILQIKKPVFGPNCLQMDLLLSLSCWLLHGFLTPDLQQIISTSEK